MATKKSTKATRVRKSRNRSGKFGVAFAALTLGGFALTAIELALARRHIRDLRDVPPVSDGDAPMVSILVAALNEEKNVRAAMQSLLSLDYPNYEVVAVDDRSTDNTGEILDSMPSEKLRVIHVRELPQGWLGKNNALQMAANEARGELLLFTDADIHFTRSALRRAVRYMRDNGVDHLASAPKIAARGPWIKIVVHFFSFAFTVFMQPWKAPDPESSRHIGVGAFNLVRRDVYERVGGHTRIRMRPDDDIKLGKIVKEGGAKQELINGGGMIEVEWYPTVAEFVRGLEKNSFSGLEYNTPFAIGAAVACVALHLWPYVAVLTTRGLERKLWSAVITLQMALLGGFAKMSGDRAILGAGYPFGAAVFTWTFVAATAKTLLNNGIDWRGTHYSLDELRANRV